LAWKASVPLLLQHLHLSHNLAVLLDALLTLLLILTQLSWGLLLLQTRLPFRLSVLLLMLQCKAAQSQE
jgi:hypothetical protein